MLIASSQPHPKNICGFYVGEGFRSHIIVTSANDSLFFDGHCSKLECYGCEIKIVKGKVLYFSSNAIDNIELYFSDNYTTLSFADISFKKYSLEDSLKPYSDSLFFYMGLGYLQAAISNNNAYRKPLLLRAALPYFKKSTEHNDTVNPLLDYGQVYFRLGIPDSAKIIWDRGRKKTPNDSHWTEYYKDLGSLYMKNAIKEYNNNDIANAIELMKKGTLTDPTSENLWYNLGGILYTVRRYEEAREAFNKTLQINPKNKKAKAALASIKEKDDDK